MKTGVPVRPGMMLVTGVAFGALLAGAQRLTVGEINCVFATLGGALFAVGWLIVLPMFLSVRAASEERDRFHKFTERARRVLTLAQEEAQGFGHPYIATEHLALGLIGEADGVAAKVLVNLGGEPDRVRSAVKSIVRRGDHAALGEIGLTPRAKKAIELAVHKARRLRHDYIGTEHLLLGLLAEREGIGAQAFASLGVDLEHARTEVLRVLAAGDRDWLPDTSDADLATLQQRAE